LASSFLVNMAISLRRSRRATKKGVSDYNVGDIVEIDRQHGIIARGRLAQLLTEGPSPNPRWLVKFDSQPYKDEEMYERAFGKLIHSNEDSNEEQHPAATETVSSVATGKGGGTSSEGEKSDDAKNKGKNSNNSNNNGANISSATTSTTKSKSVQFQRGSSASNDGSDDSSPTEENSTGGKSRYRTLADRVSAREARSRRRQAMIDDAAIVPGTEILAGKRKLPPPPGHHSSKKYKHNDRYAEDGEVVKVKLLTGTLYLYRGAQRRVEFVRRV